MCKTKQLIVVIHILHDKNTDMCKYTCNQVKIAFDNGASGVFLTIGDATISPQQIIDCYKYVRRIYNNQFIGINFMCNHKIAAELIPEDANALWIDKGLGSIDYYDEINETKNILKCRNWNGLYFGVANYDDLKNLYWESSNYFDVCVTSGVSTGISIDPEILEIVSSKANNTPLALASGININNVGDFISHVKYFIVGTGVEKCSEDENIIQFYKDACLPNPVDIGCLDPKKISDISNKINNYELQQ